MMMFFKRFKIQFKMSYVRQTLFLFDPLKTRERSLPFWLQAQTKTICCQELI